MSGNISPSGTSTGAIVASISRDHPNYWYSWTRDSALTMDVLTILQEFVDEHPELDINVQSKSQLDTYFSNYAKFSYKNQHTRTRSQDIDESNLGEPKFNVDGSAYDQPWGRPQNDGPALRSYAMIKYLQASGRKTDWYSSDKESIIKMDCEYVSQKLSSPSFDLWEEVLGMHFYNAVVYDKSLEACSQIATAYNDLGAASWYAKQRQIAQQHIRNHMNGDYIIQTYDKRGGANKPSNLDIATVLAILHTSVQPGDTVYASHPKVLATVVKLQKAFYNVYPLNNSPEKIKEAKENNLGIAYGRYPEDMYNGYDSSGNANPWFLATASIGEYFYLLVSEYTALKKIEVNNANKEFFRDTLNLSLDNGVYDENHPSFSAVLKQLFKLGDNQIRRMLFHAGSPLKSTTNGHFSEQFNLKSGFMEGAKDLTWSHASYLTAIIKRVNAAKALGVKESSLEQSLMALDIDEEEKEDFMEFQGFNKKSIPTKAYQPILATKFNQPMMSASNLQPQRRVSFNSKPQRNPQLRPATRFTNKGFSARPVKMVGSSVFFK